MPSVECLERPTNAARKTEWLAYATVIGLSAHHGMTKEQIIHDVTKAQLRIGSLLYEVDL